MLQQITYQTLIKSRFPENTPLSQSDKNSLATLNKWISHLGKQLSDQIGTEFGGSFTETLDDFLGNYNNYSTQNSNKTHINKWYHLYKNIVPPPINIKNHTFVSFIKQRMKEVGIAPKKIEKKIGTTSIYSWLNGTMPTKNSISSLNNLSIILDLPENFLVKNFLPNESSIHKLTKKPSDFSKKIIALSKKSYFMSKTDWEGTEFKEVRKTYLKYFEYKTADILEINIKRNKNQKWSVRQDGSCGSSMMFKNIIFSYFSYLKCIKKTPPPYSFSQFIDLNFFLGYLKFYKDRHSGEYTKTSILALQQVIALIDFYCQYPMDLVDTDLPFILDIKSKNISNENEIKKNIILELTKIREYYNDTKKSLNVSLSRDPEIELKPFLNLKSPIEPIFDLLHRLKGNYKKLSALSVNQQSLHILARNIVLIQLVLEKPVRAKNLEICEFEKHLLKRDDGRWFVQFKANEVKNKREIKKILTQDLSDWISIYKEKHHAYFQKDKSSLRAFLSSKTGMPMSSEELSTTIFKITKSYLGVGLRLHSIRHLRATDYLRKNPKDFPYLATLLDDNLATVIAKYSHVNQQDICENDDKDLDACYLEKSKSEDK